MIISKTNCTTFILTLAMISCLADAEPGDQEKAQRKDREHHHGVRATVVRIFRALDSDGNRIITLDEFLARPLEKAADQFDRIDADDDGVISFEEFSALRADRLAHSDIDVEELRACIAEHLNTEVPERPSLETRFDIVDSNGDGFIDIDEFVDARTDSNKFNRIDADADAAITPKEMAVALQALRQHRRIRQACLEEERDGRELLEG